MKTLTALVAGVAGGCTRGRSRATAQSPSKSKPSTSFTVVESSIADLRAAMEQGRTTSKEIVRQYLMRVGIYEDRLHAAITVNPKAMELADERDRERAQGRIRGP